MACCGCAGRTFATLAASMSAGADGTTQRLPMVGSSWSGHDEAMSANTAFNDVSVPLSGSPSGGRGERRLMGALLAYVSMVSAGVAAATVVVLAGVPVEALIASF